MPSPPFISVIRRRRLALKENSPIFRSRNLVLGCSILISLFFFMLILAASAGYVTITQDLPSLDTLPALLDRETGLLLEPTRIYDRTGTKLIYTLENPALDQHRKFLSTQQDLPEHFSQELMNAVIASSDPGFWTHAGYRLEGWKEGFHTTIAQNLVSDLLLWNEPPSLLKSIRERLLAAQITSRFGRMQILEWYLNSAKFGPMLFGADSAAHVYFGKSASQLNLAEAALLAAVAQTPALNPTTASDMAASLIHSTVDKMLAQGWITSAEAENAKQTKISIRPSSTIRGKHAALISQTALHQLQEETILDIVIRGGFRVTTTIDFDLQESVLCTEDTFRARMGLPGIESPDTDRKDCKASQLLPAMSDLGITPEGDLTTNVVILDPKTGQILALLGERDGGKDPTQFPGHPPGSLITPFIYLTAFSRGLSPATLTWDIPESLPAQAKAFQNLVSVFYGPVRLRSAMANDYLIPAIQLLNQMGHETFWKTLSQLNFQFRLQPNEDPLLLPAEGGEITLLNASHTFGILANQGVSAGRSFNFDDPVPAEQLEPYLILRVDDNHGVEWLDWSSNQSLPVISPQLTYLVTHVLSDPVARWQSLGHPNNLEVGFPVGAKMGASVDKQSTWTIGYTPDLVIGVWVGYSDHAGGYPSISPLIASGIWHALMQFASSDESKRGWDLPQGLNTVRVCDPSGLLPTLECPKTADEIFLSGNEPTHQDNLYQKIRVNRETGRLATVFTPPELVDEHVYLIGPPEAASWIQEMGIPIPPEEYDIIGSGDSSTNVMHILNPPPFSIVSGQVKISGTASGQAFNSYRIEVGAGLNPRAWYQIGEEHTSPVAAGGLELWDTTGLEGLYAIRLLVIRKDNHIERTTVQVTVDNEPPQISILHPKPNQVFTESDSRTIIINVDAYDNLAVSNVVFYIDSVLISARTQTPYSVSWNGNPGEHHLKVIALDTAGNQSEAMLSFSIR